MRKINKIIIHCSATPCARVLKVNEIRDWHIKRGFTDVGYHYIIHQSGYIEKGRPVLRVGAHCKGHNRDSIGICYVGGLDNGKPCDTRTPFQIKALKHLLLHLLNQFPIVSIHGHNEFANKACPCFDVKKEYSSLLKGGVNNE